MLGQVLTYMIVTHAAALLAFHGYCQQRDRQQVAGRNAYPALARKPQDKTKGAYQVDQDFVLLAGF